MSFNPKLLETIGSLDIAPWQGTLYRHVIGDREPLLENRRGARWNPKDVPAIYFSLDRTTVIAEADHLISLQPIPIHRRRRIVLFEARFSKVIRISDDISLNKLGVSRLSLATLDWEITQQIGAAVEWDEVEALLVPSARASGSNLVVFPNNKLETSMLEQTNVEQFGETPP